jgi:CheY-specific phosphatase CheX
VTEETITSEDITAFIGVAGRLEGNVFYGFKRSVARAILTIMLGKPRPEWTRWPFPHSGSSPI